MLQSHCEEISTCRPDISLYKNGNVISIYSAFTDKCRNLNTAGLNDPLHMGLELKTSSLNWENSTNFCTYKGKTRSDLLYWKRCWGFFCINSIAHQDKLLLHSVGVTELTKHFTITTG